MPESTNASDMERDTLSRGIEVFRLYCGIVVLSFAQHGQGLRDTIARNFVARGMICTQSIVAVWNAGSDQDAWILHRSLLDRLLHLVHLGVTDGFSDFEEFSFRSMFEARQQLLADPQMSTKVPPGLKELQKANKARYEAIDPTRPRWRRPKAEVVAKTMDLGFLYRFGYDYASTHVHPMADDGEVDFKTLTSPAHLVTRPDATVVRNSILVQTLLVHEALNVSTLRWHAMVYDFLDQIRTFLGTGDTQQIDETFYNIGRFWPGVQICKPTKTSER